MPAKVRVTTVMVLFLLTFVLLQGCGSSSREGDTPAVGQSLNLSLASSGGANTLVAHGDNSLQLQMTVTTVDGDAVVNTPVAFSTDLGFLSAVPGTHVMSNVAPKATTTTRQTTVAANTITVATDSNGVALVQLTSGGAVGTATVSADVEGFRQTMTVNFISGVPTQMHLVSQPSTVGVGETASMVATVTDANDQPVGGITVTFSLTTANSSGSFLSVLNAVTGADGTAKVTYTAGTTPGTDTIEALLATSALATGNSISNATDVTVQEAGSPAASSLELLVSSPQLDSDGSETVVLTALARDENNNFISGIDVSFQASSGGIQVINGTTDEAGTATARLTTAGDPANRTINVTATSSTLLESKNAVEVSGTTLIISGTNALALGGTTTISLLLQDSGGNGIPNECVTVASQQENGLTTSQESCPQPEDPLAIAVKTDTNGQATVAVSADNGGTDSITAWTLQRVVTTDGKPDKMTRVEGTFTLTVSSANFTFIAPASDHPEVDLGASETITIEWKDEDDNPVTGQTINFFATRGILTAPSAVTSASGTASVQITSSSAGPAVITAEAAEPSGPSNQMTIEFVATDAASLILEAKPSSLGVNPPGTNDQKSLVTAIVRDVNNNLVKNQQVTFTLTDTTGGSIFPASATTDSYGRASTVYTAGATVSAQDGIIIDAEVIGTTGCNPTDTIPAGPCDRVTLTVAQQSLFVTLGASHLIETPTNTQYAKPYSVLVTDGNSNPVTGAKVELNIYPTRYQKGFYVHVFDENDNCVGWGKFLTINPANGDDDSDKACENEDLSRNGILNTGEDYNANGTLDPGNTATVPKTVTTDDSGFAFFHVTYAREFTWIEVQLEARVTVAGSEGSSTAKFFLPGIASDFDDCKVPPPGEYSPEGLALTCGCNEDTDPTCPTWP